MSLHNVPITPLDLSPHRNPTTLGGYLDIPVSQAELQAVRLVEQIRPPSLRQYDQIPMNPVDMVRQAKLMGGQLAGCSVAFVGDHDSTSLLIGLLANIGSIPMPERMHVFDFDERLLVAGERLARYGGFAHLFGTTLYNVFDPLPGELVGQFDWFYTNPPYGSRNSGHSARLFITRGMELMRRKGKARGCIILPDDDERRWAEKAMYVTQCFMTEHGWSVKEKVEGLHGYRLDDDKNLTSVLLIVKRVVENVSIGELPFAGRRVGFDEIPLFYGRSVEAPYPRYILHDGSTDSGW